ncbi:PREDICTED: putative fatty acyl-CoA reductase CG5065 [Dufourea novaeangliae]|uniref:putative fatty acyl-CoA reductase CG5065 n=1 Tax=Dufourea novaeangliae TaxID=178035 RepID=UPI0007679534|nr:PREDICTED: putative fatty acyl-CoA reductase CG5065 [Dufourea novaeangliae]
MTSERSDAYIDDILDFSELPALNNEKSNIVEFFAQTNVLVTGGTGFLGKLLIEKLLRSCPDIKTLYMVVRSKKGKSSEERFKEAFDEVIYERLKREQPNFFNKVVMIEGDAAEEDFGFTPEIKEILMNTNIIFHAAATVRFDEKLRLAVNINVRSTKSMLLFARQLPNLKAYVHVSTAYSHCVRKSIDEKHYDAPIEGDKLISLVDSLDDDKLLKIGPVLLDHWPNNYVVTKATGEYMVLKYGVGLPICIVRPSIIISTAKEPIIAWTNNLYGATGVVMGTALGLLRTLHCKPEVKADIIPADYVVNNIVSAAWGIGNRKLPELEQQSNLSNEDKIPIYNTVSSCQRPITWGQFLELNKFYGISVPSKKVLWYHSIILQRNFFLYHIYSFFLHSIPAVIVDTIAYLIGQKPILVDAYRKIHKFSKVIHYFSTQEWEFRNENVMKLWQKLNSVDRETFYFNMEHLDWHEYHYHHIRGLRMYMLKDPLDTIEEGLVKYRKLRIAHYTILTIIALLLLWMFVSFVSFLWSFCPLAH